MGDILAHVGKLTPVLSVESSCKPFGRASKSVLAFRSISGVKLKTIENFPFSWPCGVVGLEPQRDGNLLSLRYPQN